MIITSLLLAAAVSCPSPILELEEGLTPTEQDAKVMKSVTEGCKRYYGADSCVRKLIKKSDTNYHVICFSPGRDSRKG